MAKPSKFSGGLLVFCAPPLLPPDNLLDQTATAAARDPNPVALGGRALQALPGLTTISGITLEATATYIADAHEDVGSATLVALDLNQHRDNEGVFSMPVEIQHNPYECDRAGRRASSQPN